MSVRAVLARPHGADFEGVYLHHGGEPSELGPVLWTLMRDRYGFDAAKFSREMIDQNLAGWSNIYCLGGPLAKTWDGRTKLTVEQHQDNFNSDRDDAGPTSFQGDRQREMAGVTAPPCVPGNTWGADLVYVVAADGLVVLVAEGEAGPYTRIAALPWGAEPDWDAVDAAMDEVYERAQAAYEASGAAETAESNAIVASSFEQVQRGDVAGAQRTLLAYLGQGGAKTPAVLTNVFYTLQHVMLPDAQMHAVIDDTLATIVSRPATMNATLIENICIVLNNVGRGAQSLQLCEHAMAHGVPLSVNCYVGLTFGAFTTHDPAVMQRAVALVEGLDEGWLAENPTVFDNIAALYVALGNKAKALDYVRLCKKHGYENFAAMPTMPDYAAIKDDRDFKKIFR